MGSKPDPKEDRSQAQLLASWNGDPQFMQSLARGLLALQTIVGGQGKPISARQVSALTGLSLAAAQRCIYTLHAIGYVRANRNGAVPGAQLAELLRGYAASSPLVWGCGPVLDELHEELGVTTSLATFAGTNPTIVASHSTESLLRIEIPAGAVVPLHSTSIGRIYLSTLSEPELEPRLAAINYIPHTPHTLLTPEALKKEVLEARLRGYAMTDQELVMGVRTASVPIVNSHGTTAGCVNVTTLRAGVSLRKLQTVMIPALMKASKRLSALLS